MTNVIVSMWAAMSITVYWLELFRGPYKFRWLNFRPLNCAMCLPVWLFAILVHLPVTWQPHLIGVAAAFTVGILTPIFIKAISK